MKLCTPFSKQQTKYLRQVRKRDCFKREILQQIAFVLMIQRSRNAICSARNFC